jgi:predicted metalloendopeptidase
MAFFPFVVLCLLAQTASNSRIRVENLDRTCKPCDDFWRFASGTWLDKNPIPAAFQSWGPSQLMAKANRERLQTILETARARVPPLLAPRNANSATSIPVAWIEPPLTPAASPL